MKNLTAVLLFSCLLLWNTTHAVVRTTLKLGEVLHHSSSLCSAKQKFCLKFATVEYDPSLTYLVIDNTEFSTGYWDWIANRNDPIANNSGALTLNQSGSLIITSQNGDPITLSSPFKAIINAVVILSDSGNLILQELNADGSKKRVLWQSFDHPADILLPGMKLGVNHKTGESWSIVASVSTGNPASGSYTLEWEPRKGQLIVKRLGKIYWTSGVLRNKRFENIPEKSQLMYEFYVVSNEDEEYFSYISQNDNSQWVLFHNGQLMDTRGGDIARADACYGYNTENGCQKWEQPVCRHPGDRFEIRYGFFDHPLLAGDFVAEDSNVSLTAGDCKAICWTNCSCVGYTTYSPNGTGCKYYHGTWETANLISADVSVNILVQKHSDHKGKKKWIWRSSVIATSLLLICLVILCLGLRKRKTILQERKQESKQAMILDLRASNESINANDLREEITKRHDLTMFSYESVMEATNSFSVENKLGRGGFGPVYKGILPTGKEVAIKRLSKTSGQGIIEFKNESTLICELQHMNLVQLLGCCIHREERMLIYEYMPNKSLDFFLFDSTQSKLLDWQKRLNIIEGIAQGLLYLHKYSRLKVIHRDLKASNILLDENMNPKISDFGMARMFKQHESEANTIRIVGTYGYMSPEYAMDGVFSTKSDVFSFGVLLLEIVSGRRNNSFYSDDGPLNLVGHAWKLWKEGVALQLMDPALLNSYVHTEVLRCIHIGILCVEEDANDRPHMSNIISMLTNQSAVLSSPKRLAFNTRRTMIEAKSSSKKSNINSINKVTLSILDAR